MDKTRDFGVEIECLSRISEHDLCLHIRAMFRENGINHSCSTTFYGHETGDNRNMWKIKPDASVHTNRSRRGSHGYAFEIISPRLAGTEGLDILRKVLDLINSNVAVNVSCGLHVHHDIKTGEDVRLVMNAWIDHEKFFFACLPNSRQTNRYCKKWNDSRNTLNKLEIGHSRSASIIKHAVRRFWSNQYWDRYRSLNMEGWLLRGAIEFRLHSGTTEFEKIGAWIRLTQSFVVLALEGKFMNFKARTVTEFADFVRNNLSSENGTVASSSTFPHIHPDAKRKRLPRQGTKTRRMADLVLAGMWTKEEIVAILDAEFEPSNKGHNFQFTCRLSDFANMKHGFGWNIVVDENGVIKVDAMTVDAEGSGETEDHEAINWFVGRVNHFAHSFVTV